MLGRCSLRVLESLMTMSLYLMRSRCTRVLKFTLVREDDFVDKYLSIRSMRGSGASHFKRWPRCDNQDATRPHVYDNDVDDAMGLVLRDVLTLWW